MEETVQVEVMGQKFKLKGTHDKDYIVRVEQFLNDKIAEVQQTSGSITTSNVMVLVALNLVDDCMKKEDRINCLVKSVEEESSRLVNLMDANF